MSPARDPFGRPIVPPDPPPSAGPGPGPSPTGAGPEPGPSMPDGLPRLKHGWGGPLLGIVVMIVLGVVLAGTFGSSSGPTGSTSAVGTTDAGDGAGDEREESLLAPAGTRRALGQLRNELQPGERIVSLYLRDDELDVITTNGPDRPARRMTIDAEGLAENREQPGDAFHRGLTIAQVDDAAPQRLLAAVRRGLGGPFAARFLLLDGGDRDGDPLTWAAYLDGVPSARERWAGDAHGRHVVRTSDGAPAPTAGDRRPIVTPAGTNRSSLLRRENLRRALAAARAATWSDGRVQGVDVWPNHASVTVRRGYRQRRVTVDAGLGVRIDSRGETPQKGGLAFAAIDAAGPERALAGITRRTGRSATKRVDYVILSPRNPVFPDDRTTWNVYLRGGDPAARYWRATVDGRRVGRAGEANAP